MKGNGKSPEGDTDFMKYKSTTIEKGYEIV